MQSKEKKRKPSHPPTREVVSNGIKCLKEHGGSSLQAIKKYILANYMVDGEKISFYQEISEGGNIFSGSDKRERSVWICQDDVIFDSPQGQKTNNNFQKRLQRKLPPQRKRQSLGSFGDTLYKNAITNGGCCLKTFDPVTSFS